MEIIAWALEFSHSLEVTEEGPSGPALKESATNGRYKTINDACIDICQKSSTINAVMK